MKVNATISKLLTNSLLLKIIFALSLLNIVGYLFYGNINAVIIFILIGGLVKYFSKNMIIILGIPLLIVNLFMLGQHKNNKTFEGMENNTDNNTDTNTDNNDNSNKKINSKMNNNNSNNDNSNNDNSNNDNSNNDNSNNDNNSNKNNKSTGNSQQNIDDQNLQVSSVMNKPIDETFEVGRKKKNNNIDYASTIEDAYDELNKIIGSDGIKKLTGDTQNLMQQQLHLAEAMKGMQPLIQNMGPLMESMGPMIQQAQGLMGAGGIDMANLAKKFTASS
jgi:hypothetical protein